jgi:hypothetical protein
MVGLREKTIATGLKITMQHICQTEPRGFEPLKQAAALARHQNIALKKEGDAMSKTLGPTWEEEMLARGIEQGIERGIRMGELRARQDTLRVLLTQRFGPLPETVEQQIAATTDVQRLKACILGIFELSRLEDLLL